ncbi:hypothetical protein ACFWMT_20345 [Streptomyces sp. NPDC058368]|uniref:hypothetical protein n=1 Tax=Streptomyces sp. NPDC058368 TaxID=3346461 RepID=UPI00364888A8
MASWRRLAAVLCAVVAVSGLAGCGGTDDKAAEAKASSAPSVSDAQRMTEALETFKAYRSFGLKGEVRDEVGTSIDLHVDREGHCTGTYTRAHAVSRFVILGDRAWSAYDDATLNDSIVLAQIVGPEAVAAAKDAIAKARGKYVESSAAELTAQTALSLCRMDTAYAGVPASVTTAEHSNPRVVDGEQRVTLTHAVKDGEVVVHVPESGRPTPRGIEFEIADTPVVVDVYDADVPVDPQKPDASDVVKAEDVRGLYPFPK